MAQGLQYSVCRVQHDNPWLESILQEVEVANTGQQNGSVFLEGLAQKGQEERRQAELAGAPCAGLSADQGKQKASIRYSSDEAVDERTDRSDGRAMCLSMHQPWASLLVAGIKLVEGRGWPTDHRGRLWIASTSREPSDLEIASVERKYTEVTLDDCNQALRTSVLPRSSS